MESLAIARAAMPTEHPRRRSNGGIVNVFRSPLQREAKESQHHDAKSVGGSAVYSMQAAEPTTEELFSTEILTPLEPYPDSDRRVPEEQESVASDWHRLHSEERPAPVEHRRVAGRGGLRRSIPGSKATDR
jgi:hypothetical protein